jgi:uncharacterized tellurite resistance protein B-like protein
MNPRLRDLYANVAVHATADREHEAVLDLLVLMLVTDRHVDQDELDEIRSISDDSGFETDTFTFDQYEGRAFAKVRAAVSSGTVTALLDDIDARITNSVLRQAVFSAVRDVARADDDIDASEHSLLAEVAARFG